MAITWRRTPLCRLRIRRVSLSSCASLRVFVLGAARVEIFGMMADIASYDGHAAKRQRTDEGRVRIAHVVFFSPVIAPRDDKTAFHARRLADAHEACFDRLNAGRHTMCLVWGVRPFFFLIYFSIAGQCYLVEGRARPVVDRWNI